MIKRIRKAQVDELMAQYDRRFEEIKKRDEAVSTGSKEFMREFASCRENIIRPMMEEIGKRLQESGHGYSILPHCPAEPVEQKYRDGITMAIYPKGLDHYGAGFLAAPSISFFADALNRMVWLYETDLMSGFGNAPILAEELKMEHICNAIIERILVESLAGIFDPDKFTSDEKEYRIEKAFQRAAEPMRRRAPARAGAPARRRARRKQCIHEPAGPSPGLCL